jgi:hypothetical protein
MAGVAAVPSRPVWVDGWWNDCDTVLLPAASSIDVNITWWRVTTCKQLRFGWYVAGWIENMPWIGTEPCCEV